MKLIRWPNEFFELNNYVPVRLCKTIFEKKLGASSKLELKLDLNITEGEIKDKRFIKWFRIYERR